jgi:hypothetical protein
MTSARTAALRDYPRRIRFPVTVVLSVLALLPALKGYVEKTEWAGEYGLLLGALILIAWTGMVSGHLKLTLARPQGRLLPGYARTQVAVGLTLLLPALLLSIATGLLAHFSVLGALAMTLGLTALYWSWPYLINRGSLLLLFGPSAVWWVSAIRDKDLLSTSSGGWPLGAPAEPWLGMAIALSLGVIAWVTRRMLRLTESSFEYHNDPSFACRPGASPDSDTPFIGLFQRLLPWFGRYRIGPRPSLQGASTPQRVGQWRRGMGPRSPMVTGISMAAIVALMGCYFLIPGRDSHYAEMGVLTAYLIIFPFNRYSFMHRRRARMETESLFPGSRGRFVGEMGMATTLDILETWLFLILGTLVARASGLFTTVAWSSFPYLLALSLSTTILGLGLLPWFLRLSNEKWSSLFLSVLLVLLGGSAALVLKKIAGFSMPGIWALVCLGLAGLGILGIRQGYRLWCTLELGRNDL